MKIEFSYTEADVRKLIHDDVEKKTGTGLAAPTILVEVKSKQNYKAEWEAASFRATFTWHSNTI